MEGPPEVTRLVRTYGTGERSTTTGGSVQSGDVATPSDPPFTVHDDRHQAHGGPEATGQSQQRMGRSRAGIAATVSLTSLIPMIKADETSDETHSTRRAAGMPLPPEMRTAPIIAPLWISPWLNWEKA